VLELPASKDEVFESKMNKIIENSKNEKLFFIGVVSYSNMHDSLMIFVKVEEKP